MARKPDSGQALIEVILASGIFIAITTGIFVFGVALTTRAALAHALEEHLVCRRSTTAKIECDRRFQALVALAPGNVRVVSLRLRGGTTRATFRWRLLQFEREIRIEENSPLSE